MLILFHSKIQSVFQLSDGSGLAVTVARYETPDHTDIDKVSGLFFVQHCSLSLPVSLPPSLPLTRSLGNSSFFYLGWCDSRPSTS
jgi:hypothetical protein